MISMTFEKQNVARVHFLHKILGLRRYFLTLNCTPAANSQKTPFEAIRIQIAKGFCCRRALPRQQADRIVV
eukprot:NODE_1095_length_676_cov_96.693780_g854_i0.p3 GENE.NODE_1095_length_676_cov_96.693780_g854_i0~~NODE_1095_length_676_cov_96.693780_g854_i0.p3  ORF type:complete len:71 (-),score=0.60 NODE_1095_length_676_cov_96.693780_g854_i0:344-556(-)